MSRSASIGQGKDRHHQSCEMERLSSVKLNVSIFSSAIRPDPPSTDIYKSDHRSVSPPLEDGSRDCWILSLDLESTNMSILVSSVFSTVCQHTVNRCNDHLLGIHYVGRAQNKADNTQDLLMASHRKSCGFFRLEYWSHLPI